MRDRSASAGVVTRYFSRCLIFWCFWIKPKAQKKKCTTEEIDSYFGKYPAPPIGRFLRGADLPPFVTERWRQKCPQGTSVGIGRRFSLSGHKRLRCCGAKDCTASTVAARQSPQAASALACCPSFCTPAPGARAAAVTASAIFAVRSRRPETCHVRTQTNNHRCVQRAAASALRKVQRAASPR